jgi:hypothetical protein
MAGYEIAQNRTVALGERHMAPTAVIAPIAQRDEIK